MRKVPSGSLHHSGSQMNVAESILSTALVALIIAGYMHIATQQVHVRDADRLLEDVRVFQDALIDHQRNNPQDGVENWFEPQYQVPGDATTPLVWREVAALDPLHLEKFDLQRLNRFGFSTLMTAGMDVRSPYGTPYRLLTNGVSEMLRLELDVRGFEKLAYLLAQGIVPGLQSEVDPLPTPGTDDENTLYTVAVHLRPGFARLMHHYTVDPAEVGNPGAGLGSPLKWASFREEDRNATVHAAGARCDLYVKGAITVDVHGLPLNCQDDPKGVVVAGPIWVRPYEGATPQVDYIPCLGAPPPPPGASTMRVCPATMQSTANTCDVYIASVTVPTDVWLPDDGSPMCPGGGGGMGMGDMGGPIPPTCPGGGSPPCPPPGQCGMAITSAGAQTAVQFYEIAAGTGIRTDGALITKAAPEHFGLSASDIPASDRLDAGIDAYLGNHPHFAAWVSSFEGQGHRWRGAEHRASRTRTTRQSIGCVGFPTDTRRSCTSRETTSSTAAICVKQPRTWTARPRTAAIPG